MPLAIAIILFLVWTVVTFILEGRIRTLLRPEAKMARLAYAVIANMLIGTAGAIVAISWIATATDGASETVNGFAPLGRTLVSIVAGLALGLLILAVQRPPSWNIMVLLNGYSQTLVVSIAEVLVCWSVLGATFVTTISNVGAVPSIMAGLVVSALAFGIYHFAHSPPFNTIRLVLLLSVVGLVTGAFFYISRDVYGTIVFHNFLALKGVTQALADSGQLGSFEKRQPQLVLMAVVSVLLLIILDLALLRPSMGEFGG
jgi:hypothetical protein